MQVGDPGQFPARDQVAPAIDLDDKTLRLSIKEKEMLCQRFAIGEEGCKRTLADIGKESGVTRQAIHLRLKVIFAKLRVRIEQERLTNGLW